MATINGSTNSSLWTYKLDVYDISTNIDSNTSVTRVDVYLGRAQSRSYVGGTWSGYVSVNWKASGQITKNISGTIPYPTYIDAGAWLRIATVDFTIPHDADGRKTTRVGSEITQTEFTPSYCSADGYVTLTTIPRATKCPSLTGFIKSSYTLTLKPASGSFTHSLNVRFGSINKYVQANGELGDGEHIFSTKNPIVTLPKEFYAQFNGYEGTGTFTLKTYSNNKAIGSSSGTLKAQCNPALCNPIVTSAIVVDVNPQTLSITNNENYIIKNASIVNIAPTIQISDTDDTTAIITSKALNNTVFNTDTYTVNKPLDNTFTLTLTNSRSLTTNNIVSATGELIDYVELTFNIVNLYRPEPTTGEIKIQYNGFYFDNPFVINSVDNTTEISNTLNITWKYREKNATDWIDGGSLSPTIQHDDNVYNGNESLGTIFDYKKQYQFIFIYNDKVVSYETDVIDVSRGLPVFWWDSEDVHLLGKLLLTDKGYENFTLSIMETVEDSTGTYIKFANGILIYSTRLLVQTDNWNLWYGSNVYECNHAANITFTVPFINKDTTKLVATVQSGTTSYAGWIHGVDYTEKGINIIDISRPNNPGEDKLVIVNCFAIGKWK